MRRILAVILFCIFAFMAFLLIYTPAQDYLRHLVGPTIASVTAGIGATITQSTFWQNVVVIAPYSWVIGAVIGGFVMGSVVYLWYSGKWHIRRWGMRGAIKDSGVGFREVKGPPITTAVTNPSPTKTSTPKTEPEAEATKEEAEEK